MIKTSRKHFRRLLCLCSAFLAQGLSASEPGAEAINAVFGLKIFGDSNLFDDAPQDFAARTDLRFRSAKSADMKTAYTWEIPEPILGIKAEEFKFTFDEKGVQSVTITFFNKGDSLEKGYQVTSQIAAQMRKDAAAIQKSFDTLFGEAQNRRVGSGQMASVLKVWAFGQTEIFLDFKQKEYIIVGVQPKQEDAAKRVFADKKTDWSANVKKEDNGDVHILNIPMVDQGSKGYCVPATLERCMRYYKIENVSMHKIAEVCNSGSGGGTYMANVMEDFKKACAAYRLKIENLNMTFPAVKKYIDDGIPLCWSMFSTDAYVERMMENSAQRAKTSAESWAKELRKQKKLDADSVSGHVCLIVGYNEKTKELGVSNSWGERMALKWVRFDDAKSVGKSVFAVKPR